MRSGHLSSKILQNWDSDKWLNKICFAVKSSRSKHVAVFLNLSSGQGATRSCTGQGLGCSKMLHNSDVLFLQEFYNAMCLIGTGHSLMHCNRQALITAEKVPMEF